MGEEENISITSILTAEVPQFEEKYVNNKAETFYLIIIKNLYNNKKWSLEKTYKDFENLNSDLYKLLPSVPSFSSFQLFKSSKSYNTIVERQKEIQDYLTECLGRKDIISNKLFSSFLEIDKNFPDLVYNQPEIIEAFEDTDMSVIDLVYMENQAVIFTISCDLNLTSRLDSYVKSSDIMKWRRGETLEVDMSENEINKEDAEKGKVGSFYAFKITTYKNKNGELKIRLDKVFAKYFEEMTSALYYEPDGMLFTVGLYTGRALFYKILAESDYTQFDFMAEIRVHSGKVTGLALDSSTGHFYSCGDDKRFFSGVTNMIYSKQYCPDLVRESTSSYVRMFFDKENERLYLSTWAGNVEVYVTSTYPPTFVKETFSTSEKYPLNDFAFYPLKHYLFSCSDSGLVSVFDLGKPGQEKTTKELSYFDYYEAKIKLKAVLYDMDNNDVLTGDNYGRVIFWSLKTGKPIFVIKVGAKAVLRMKWIRNTEEQNKLLWVSCSDNSIYFIKLPIKWLNNEDIEMYEQIEIKNRSDLNAMMKIQSLLAKDEDYNSDEDSLNGWDYFANDAKEEMDKKKKKK